MEQGRWTLRASARDPEGRQHGNTPHHEWHDIANRRYSVQALSYVTGPHTVRESHCVAARWIMNIEANIGDGVPRPRLLTSTLKCFALLDSIAQHTGPVRLSDLARLEGTSRATMHQRLATLVEAGWVERLEDSRYRLTLRATSMAHCALEQAELGARVHPHLERLASDTGEAVSITVLSSNAALIVQRVESGHLLRLDLVVGTRMPLRTSASGRVLVAFAPSELVDSLRSAHVDIPSEDDLVSIRSNGYAVSANDYIDGISAVAAPMFAQKRLLHASLSLAGPATRFDPYHLLQPLLRTRDALANMMMGPTTAPDLIPRGSLSLRAHELPRQSPVEQP